MPLNRFQPCSIEIFLGHTIQHLVGLVERKTVVTHSESAGVHWLKEWDGTMMTGHCVEQVMSM